MSRDARIEKIKQEIESNKTKYKIICDSSMPISQTFLTNKKLMNEIFKNMGKVIKTFFTCKTNT